MMEGPCADFEEKHEPVSDIGTALADSLKALDPNRPIREADIGFAHLKLSETQSGGERQADLVGNATASRSIG